MDPGMRCDPKTGRYPLGVQPVGDRYTAIHGTVGVFYGAAGFPWWRAALLAVAWEILENPQKDHYPGIFPDACKDTLPNACGDVLAVMVG